MKLERYLTHKIGVLVDNEPEYYYIIEVEKNQYPFDCLINPAPKSTRAGVSLTMMANEHPERSESRLGFPVPSITSLVSWNPNSLSQAAKKVG